MRRHKRLRLLNIVLGLVVLAAMLVPGAGAAPPPPPPAAGDANLAAQALAALGYNSGEVSVIPKGATEVPGEIIVGLKAQANTAGVQALATKYGARLVGSIDPLNAYLLKVDGAQAQASVMKALAADPAVKFVEPNGVYQIHEEGSVADVEVQLTPNDPFRGLQWALTRERAYQAWDLTTGSSQVIVAVIDTGIQCTHPDITPSKCTTGFDFVNWDWNPDDDNNHGTHVAGKIGARTNNNIGIAGLSWHSLLMPVKVLNAAGSGSWFSVAQGIAFATIYGAKILNLSLGGSSPSALLQTAGQFSWAMGKLLVASSGNSGDTRANYPAAYDEFISVACTTQTDARCSFSTMHSTVELSAPGYQIYSTIRGGYGYMSGTSMSAPDVSGIAALRWARSLAQTNAQVRQCLRQGVVDLGPAGRDPSFGFGRIDALLAVQCGVAPGLGTVQGYVRDARNNAAIAGANVLLVGTTRSVTTNSNGFYQMTSVPSGARSFTASRTGYIPVTQGVTVPAGGTANLDFVLSPALPSGQWRIVLTWGANPRDLDSHLWLPPAFPRHIYYASRGSCVAFPWACLDRDDVDGYGPETITIVHNNPGNYRYAVRWFSGTGTWAASGAVVRFYRGATLWATRTVPASAASSGWWYLVNFDAVSGAMTWVNLIQAGDPRPYAVKADDAMSKPKQ